MLRTSTQDKGKATALALQRSGQGNEKASDAINYSDEEDMIDDEDAPAAALQATNGSPAPQCVLLSFAQARTLSTRRWTAWTALL